MALPGPLLTDLAALLGPRLSTTAADRALHAQSESYMTAGQPDAVVYPTSTAEVAQVTLECSKADRLLGWRPRVSIESGLAALLRGDPAHP